jgi:hypothetical protein
MSMSCQKSCHVLKVLEFCQSFFGFGFVGNGFFGWKNLGDFKEVVKSCEKCGNFEELRKGGEFYGVLRNWESFKQLWGVAKYGELCGFVKIWESFMSFPNSSTLLKIFSNFSCSEKSFIFFKLQKIIFFLFKKIIFFLFKKIFIALQNFSIFLPLTKNSHFSHFAKIPQSFSTSQKTLNFSNF